MSYIQLISNVCDESPMSFCTTLLIYSACHLSPHSDTEFTGNTALQHDFTFGGSAGHGKCLEAKLSSGKLFSSCASGQTAVYRLTVSAYTMIRQVTDKTDGVGHSEHKPDTTLLKGIRLTEYKKIYIYWQLTNDWRNSNVQITSIFSRLPTFFSWTLRGSFPKVAHAHKHNINQRQF